MFCGSVVAVKELSFDGNGEPSIPPRGRPRINTGSASHDDGSRHTIPTKRTTKSNLLNSILLLNDITSLSCNQCQLSTNITNFTIYNKITIATHSRDKFIVYIKEHRIYMTPNT